MEEDLITAYNEAEYRVNGFSEPIYIGKYSEDADKVLSKNNLTEWAYITAYNPMSCSLEEEENIRRNSELRKLVNDYIVIEGEGQDKQKEWPAEKSFFIAGILILLLSTFSRYLLKLGFQSYKYLCWLSRYKCLISKYVG